MAAGLVAPATQLGKGGGAVLVLGTKAMATRPVKREDPITAPRCPLCGFILERDIDAIHLGGQRVAICRRKMDIIRQGERQRCGQRVYIVVEDRIAHVHPITRERYEWVLQYARKHGHGPPNPMGEAA